MATGGSGDVLTGMIAGLLAQGFEADAAAAAGVYLHGLAGDRAAERLGETAVAAGDLIAALPEAHRAVERAGRP
jgi:NAD(P)H-hydrate epimerase